MRKIADIANDYEITDSTTFDIIGLVEKALLADERFHLPSLCQIQRPKKNSENSTPAKRNVIL